MHYFTSNVNYLINIWGNTTQSNIDRLQRQQNKILKTLFKIPHRTPTKELSIRKRIALNNILLMYKINKGLIKTDMSFKKNNDIHNYNTTIRNNLRTYRYTSNKYSMSTTTQMVTLYNKIPDHIKELKYHTFKQKIKYMLLNGQL